MSTTQNPRYRSTDPSTGQVVAEYPHLAQDALEQALAASSTAYEAWREEPLEHRAAVVTKVGQLFAERAQDLGRLAEQEMGKTADEGAGEAEFCESIFSYYGSEGPGLLADQVLPGFDGGKAVVRRRAVGPVLGIMPWNFPFYQIARFAAPNLLLGNTVLLKHAESVPRCAIAVEELMHDAGAPVGVYTNLFATFEQVDQVIDDPRVQGVSLTGSERAGAAVAAAAGRSLKKCVLELGGSDPYVLLDGDAEELAETAWSTRMFNMGQACNSNKRIIVMDDLYDDVVASLTQHARSAAASGFAPLSSRRAAEALDEQVKDAVAQGAVLHAGGELGRAPSAYYSPAVLTGVTPSMRAFHEELFGPVAVVYRASTDGEAVDLANDSPYGLGGAVFSRDTRRAEAVAAKIDAGMVNVNTPSGEGPGIPFGGVKRSGFGRELGPLGLDEFANKQTFVVADA